MKWINYHHLIYFREIAKQKSISKASKILCVGQPALSAQLKKFEQDRDIALFERKNKKLLLTESGKVVLEYAEKINELGQELIQVISQRSFIKRAQLCVGAADAVPKQLVSHILDFVHKKSGCFLSIFEGDPIKMLTELKAHQLDVIISDQDLVTSGQKNIFSKKIITSKVCVYGAKKFEHLKENFPLSLDGAPAILPTVHSRMHSDLENYFHNRKIFLDKVAEAQDSMLIKILCCKGDGVIFLPEFASQQLVEEKKIVKLGQLDEINVNYYLQYSKKIIENPALKLLLEQDIDF